MSCRLKCWPKMMHNLRGVELSFIWGKMRPAAQEAALQVVLRDCSRGSQERSTCKILGKEEFRAVNCWLRASLVAQLGKNPPEMQETWVWSLGWEDSWRRERLPTPIFWPGEFHGLYIPWGCKESDMTEKLSQKYEVLIEGHVTPFCFP